jgi:5-methylcytosine-specific restriction endonuclease McrA
MDNCMNVSIVEKYKEKIALGKIRGIRSFSKEIGLPTKVVVDALREAGLIRKGLAEHRQMLEAFSPDNAQINELAKKMANMAYNTTAKDTVVSLIPIVKAILETQDFLPFFWEETEGYLPSCWNAPKDWNLTYIKYEIGHISPKVSGGTDELENLCGMCARCNNHIQSSLSMDEVIARNSPKIADRARLVLERRSKLFQSPKWLELKSNIGKTLLSEQEMVEKAFRHRGNYFKE